MMTIINHHNPCPQLAPNTLHHRQSPARSSSHAGDHPPGADLAQPAVAPHSRGQYQDAGVSAGTAGVQWGVPGWAAEV